MARERDGGRQGSIQKRQCQGSGHGIHARLGAIVARVVPWPDPKPKGRLSPMTSSSTPNTRAPRRRAGIGAAAKMGLVLFTALLVLGVVGAGVAVAGFTQLSQGLPDPKMLEKIELPEQSIIYDRSTRSSWPGSASSSARSSLRRDPAGPRRRDDRGRGQDLLGQRRLRPGGASSRPRSTRSAATAAARRPSPSSSSASGCSTRPSSRTRIGPPSASSRRSSSRSG